MRKRIYLAGPMSLGDRLDNLHQALRVYRLLIDKGYAPLCPQLTSMVGWIIPADHQTWIDVDLPWVKASDAVLRLPGDSRGADAEVACAREHRIPVFTHLGRFLQEFPA